MKKIGLIMLLCVVALYGCKSRQSHVQKSSLDSVASNRESINLDVQATAYRAQHTLLTSGSNWMNGMSLKNFSGQLTVVSGQLQVKGKADSIGIIQAGAKHQEENIKTERR